MSRPLSQQGLVHVPLNPKQRDWAGGHRRTKLDAQNATQRRRWLHPTKGWRTFSTRRSVIAIITADVRTGTQVPLSMMRALIRKAREEDTHVTH